MYLGKMWVVYYRDESCNNIIISHAFYKEKEAREYFQEKNSLKCKELKLVLQKVVEEVIETGDQND